MTANDEISIISPTTENLNQPDIEKVLVNKDLFSKDIRGRARRTSIAEFYGIVYPGLVLAKNCFRGIQRGVFADGDMDTSDRVFVYTWKPRFTYFWHGDNNGRIIKTSAPENKVFAVLIKKDLETNGGLFGSIVYWNWLKEAKTLANAPVDYEQRYEEHCWSK